MALARASRIQDKLNSNELKSDGPIWKHATPVLNCFRRALEIDSSNLSLWIEFGTMSYALHSFASRQLKQWRPELPPELVQQVRGRGGRCPGVHASLVPGLWTPGPGWVSPGPVSCERWSATSFRAVEKLLSLPCSLRGAC